MFISFPSASSNKCLTTRNKDATRGSWHRYERSVRTLLVATFGWCWSSGFDPPASPDIDNSSPAHGGGGACIVCFICLTTVQAGARALKRSVVQAWLGILDAFGAGGWLFFWWFFFGRAGRGRGLVKEYKQQSFE